MLGRIREKNGWDDIVLLDKDYHLSESFSSSLFWINRRKIYTPSFNRVRIWCVMKSFIIVFYERNR